MTAPRLPRVPRAPRAGVGEQGDFFAPTSWQSLTAACVEVARDLGLAVETEVYVGRRIWGARRRIDLVVTDPTLRRSLGIEAKYQRTSGSAEEKIPTPIEDIAAWPIPGLVSFYGPGFSANMRAFLQASGKAVDLADLETWLRLYFVLPAPRGSFAAATRGPADAGDAPEAPSDEGDEDEDSEADSSRPRASSGG